MKHLIIKNVGPISHADILLKRFNVFVGPQSSGKSTVAKIFSTCSWIEKEVATTLDEKAVATGEDFKHLVSEFHKMHGYFHDDSFISYETEVFSLCYCYGTLGVQLKPGINYRRQKICYIPSERNMVTLPELQGFEFGSTSLRSFLFDWFSAREHYNPENKSSVLGLGVKYYYDRNQKRNKDYIEHVNGKTYNIPLSSASSGLQSIVPMLIILQYYSSEGYYGKVGSKTSFEQDDKERALTAKLVDTIVLERMFPNEFGVSNRSELIKKANAQIHDSNPDFVRAFKEYLHRRDQLLIPESTTFIVEEPEQNLYPETQIEALEAMVKLCQNGRHHCLTITTHSPYIVNYINILLARYYTDRSNCNINPDDLNVFAIQDGILIDQMLHNTVTGHISVRPDELTDTMQTMYKEYCTLKHSTSQC